MQKHAKTCKKHEKTNKNIKTLRFFSKKHGMYERIIPFKHEKTIKTPKH